METTPANAVPCGRCRAGDCRCPRNASRRRDCKSNSLFWSAKLLDKAKLGGIDVYFVGDSIVRRWGATDYPELLENWRANFFGWNAGDFGWGADRTQNILWRLENGELDGVNPKVIVLLAGTNNVGTEARDEAAVAEIARGIKAIIDVCRRKAPKATILQIATTSGFGSPWTFTRWFRDAFGVTPGEYRAQAVARGKRRK